MKEWMAQFLAIFIFALWERFLGKTKKLESNSTIELIESGVNKVKSKLKGE